MTEIGGADGARRAGGRPDEGPGAEAPGEDVVELAGRLFEMARRGDAAGLAAYLDAGVPPNLANDRGDTLVMLAAYHGHAGAVAALLARGAEPDRANDRGQTPLAGAVFKGEDAVVEALLAGGADPAAGTPSALDTARMFGKDDLVGRFTAAAPEAFRRRRRGVLAGPAIGP